MRRKLIGSGIPSHEVYSMDKMELGNAYRRIIGIRKIRHYKPILFEDYPFFEENLILKSWPARRMKLVRSTSPISTTCSISVVDRDSRETIVTKHTRETISYYDSNGKECKRFKDRVTHKVIPLRINNSQSIPVVEYTPKTLNRFKSVLPIKPGKTCRFIGFAPFAMGSRKQKVNGPDLAATRFLKDEKTQKLFPELDIPNKYGVVGSWVSQMSELQDFVDSKPRAFILSSIEMINMVSPYLDLIQLPEMDRVRPSFALGVETNPSSYAGKYSELLYGGRTHAEVDHFIREPAEQMIKAAMSGIVVDNTIWTIGGRVRMMSADKVGTPLRSRLLIMPEGITKLVGLSTIQEFYRRLSILQIQYPANEICLGKTFLHGHYESFHNCNAEYDEVIEADLSRFDQNANEEVIVAAFSILRGCFPEGDDMDLLFFHHCGSFTYKNIVTPGSFVYRVHKGIATGSPFTSIIGTLVNWINCTIFCISIGVLRDRLIRVYGDDTLIFIKGCFPMEEDKLATAFTYFTNFPVDPFVLKSVDPPPWETPYTFLKTYFKRGLPCKSVVNTMERALWMEFPAKNYIEWIAHLDNFFMITPFDIKSMQVLSMFRDYLYCYFKSGTPIGSTNEVKNFSFSLSDNERLITGRSLYFSKKNFIFSVNDKIYNWEQRGSGSVHYSFSPSFIMDSSIMELLKVEFKKDRKYKNFQIFQPPVRDYEFPYEYVVPFNSWSEFEIAESKPAGNDIFRDKGSGDFELDFLLDD